jgi:hypothetical protein
MDGAQAVANVLEHFGTKGMKWGIRKERSSAVSVTQKPSSRVPGRRLKTKGGFGRSASEEAIVSRTTGQVIRKSGVHALSNKELQDYTKRLNLEQQAKRLQYESSSPPVKFVKKLLGQTGKTAAQDAANQASSVAVKKALKRAAIVAA